MEASARRSLIRDVKIIEILQDEAGKVWLFYAEPYSQAVRTIGATIEDRDSFVAIKFRFMNLFAAEQEDAIEGELSPIDEPHWGEGRPGWEGSADQQRILKIADDHDLSMVQVLELPFLPKKEVKVVDE